MRLKPSVQKNANIYILGQTHEPDDVVCVKQINTGDETRLGLVHSAENQKKTRERSPTFVGNWNFF